MPLRGIFVSDIDCRSGLRQRESDGKILFYIHFRFT